MRTSLILGLALAALGAVSAQAQSCLVDPGSVSLATGERAPLRCLANGALITNATGGGGGGDGAITAPLGTATAAADGVSVSPAATTVWPASQSGTWTMQPGNTANTVPWLISIVQGGNTASVTSTGKLQVQAIVNAGNITAGGSTSGSVASMGTATAYTANQAIGGLQTISVFRTPNEGASPRSGTLARVRVGLKGTNQTPPLTVYVWEANPTATTCTNAATFVSGAADWAFLVGAFPVVPAAPTGTSMTTGYVDVAIPVINRDGALTNNLYACVVTGASVTLAANDMTLSLRVNQD